VFGGPFWLVTVTHAKRKSTVMKQLIFKSESSFYLVYGHYLSETAALRIKPEAFTKLKLAIS